jgi:hypothetical protein
MDKGKKGSQRKRYNIMKGDDARKAIYVFNITSKVQRDGGKDDGILINGEATTRKFFRPKAQTPGILHTRSDLPVCQTKRHDEGRERRSITWLRTCRGKRQSKYSAHIQDTDMSFKYK